MPQTDTTYVAPPQPLPGPMPAAALADTATASGPVAAMPLVKELQRPQLWITMPEPAEQPPLWAEGLEGTPRTVAIGDNSAVLALVSGVLIAMMVGFRHFRRLFGVLIGTLRGMRSRGNAFDEHTSAEARMMLLMSAQWCVGTGLLAYSAISCFVPGASLPPTRAFTHTGLLIALMAVYYLFQLAAYSVLGYTFADSAGRRIFVGSFTASQALLGLGLLVPALLSIFYPAACVVAVWAGAALYLAARIVFIAKGFKIFYTNFTSLFYFILYLCSLEIIPLFAVAYAAVWAVEAL